MRDVDPTMSVPLLVVQMVESAPHAVRGSGSGRRRYPTEWVEWLMRPFGSWSYVSLVLLARHRALLVTACLLALVGLAVTASSHPQDRATRVGTTGAPGLDVATNAPPGEGVVPSSSSTVLTSTVESGAASSATTAAPPRPPSTTLAATGTSDPQPATTATTKPLPRTLVGRVAYITGDGATPPTTEIGSMLPDGSDRRIEDLHCPAGASLLGPTLDVSPDGTQIVRDCGTPTDPNAAVSGYGLVVQEVASGATRTLLPPRLFGVLPPTQYTGAVHWSPDGRQLAVGASQSVGIIDVATGAIRDVPTDGSIGWTYPTWSPDGTRLLSSGLHILDLGTGTITDRSDLIPAFPAENCSSEGGAWGPDGAFYVQASVGCIEPNVTRYLYRIDPATGSTMLLVDQPGFMDNIAFLPGGRILLRNGTTTAMTIATDGSHPETFDLPWPITSFTAARGSGS